jgi:MFS family permease
MGLMFSPSVGTLAHHFGGSRWRNAAYGAQASGSCLGGVIFPLLARSLFPVLGFGWTVRICEFDHKLWKFANIES